MKTIKLVLMLVGFIALVVLAFFLFGFAVALLQYLLVIGAVVLVGLLAYKVLRNPERAQPQLTDFKQQDKELARVRRKLDEYKRKELPK